jgi:DNA-binding transcriptional regulator YhcF (GntR family)
MTLNFADEKPIYLQIAEEIEDAILSGHLKRMGKFHPLPKYRSTTKLIRLLR